MKRKQAEGNPRLVYSNAMPDLYAQAVTLELTTGQRVVAYSHVSATDEHLPNCLLLHGNPGSLRDWTRLYAPLSSAAHVTAIDLPGFGHSPRPAASSKRALELDALADDVAATLDALGWREPCYLVGYSHGGGIAQAVAARHPQRVAGVVAVGTLGYPAHRSYRLLGWRPWGFSVAHAVARLATAVFGRAALRGISRRIVRWVMRDIYSPETVDDAQVTAELEGLRSAPTILQSMVDVTLGAPSACLLKYATKIFCPVLFVHGERDALVPVRYARALHAAILAGGGNATFLTIQSAGHMLIEFQVERVTQAITAFIQSTQASLEGHS